jgi:hypothetical protein
MLMQKNLVATDGKELVIMVLKCNDLEIVIFFTALEESNQGHEALGTFVQGAELVTTDAITGLLEEAIFEHPERTPSIDNGCSQKWRLHLIKEDMAVGVLQGEQVDLGAVEEHGSLFLTEFHGAKVLLPLFFGNDPEGDVHADIQGEEVATVLQLLLVKLGFPEFGVVATLGLGLG